MRGKRQARGRSLTTGHQTAVQKALSDAGVNVVAELAAIVRSESTHAGLKARILLDLLPYVAPRLSSVEVRSEAEVRYVVEVPEGTLQPITPEDWQRRYAPDWAKDAKPIVIDAESEP
jgi:hypothetical protein